MAALHLYPVNDEKSHLLDGVGDCWCEPEVQWLDPETNLPWAGPDQPLIIHNSADGRELVEQAEEIARREARGDL